MDKEQGKITDKPVKSRASMIIDGDIEPESEQEKTLLNLRKRKSFDKWDREEHRKASIKGGQAIAEMYGEKKTAKQALESILSLKVSETMLDDSDISPDLIAKIKRTNPQATIYDLIQAVAVGKALQGSMRALEYVRDTNGDKPKDALEVTNTITEADKALLQSIQDRLERAEVVVVQDAEVTG